MHSSCIHLALAAVLLGSKSWWPRLPPSSTAYSWLLVALKAGKLELVCNGHGLHVSSNVL